MRLPPFNTAKRWLDAILGLFYPEVCQHCGVERAAVDDGYLCHQCRQQARPIAAPFCQRCGLPYAGDLTTSFECHHCRGLELGFRWARSAVAAEGMVLEVIRRYKYQAALWFEPYLARLLVDAARPSLSPGDWDMIVPVPLHRLKQSEREFNQAERLARCLGRALGLPVHSRLLRRVRPTHTQTRLSRTARQRNVRGAFRLDHPAQARQRRIVLVDDVFTTGATTSACAHLLHSAGAADVCVWTVARGLYH